MSSLIRKSLIIHHFTQRRKKVLKSLVLFCFDAYMLSRQLMGNPTTYALTNKIHSKQKKYFRAPFWCFRFSQIEDSIQYLEKPNSTRKDQIVPGRTMIGIPFVHLDPKIPIMDLPGTIWSFQVLNRVLYLWQPEAPKKVLWSTFFLRVCLTAHVDHAKRITHCSQNYIQRTKHPSQKAS